MNLFAPMVAQAPVKSTTPMGSFFNLSAEDYRDLAWLTSKEAGPGEDHVYVAASVLNRVASPMFPNTIRKVATQPKQYEAYTLGKLHEMPERAAWYASPEGQVALLKASQKLQGRTNFKGQSELANKHKSDIMVHPRGNFFHHWWEEKGAVKPKNWKTPSLDKLINPQYRKYKDTLQSPTGLGDLYRGINKSNTSWKPDRMFRNQGTQKNLQIAGAMRFRPEQPVVPKKDTRNPIEKFWDETFVEPVRAYQDKLNEQEMMIKSIRQ